MPLKRGCRLLTCLTPFYDGKLFRTVINTFASDVIKQLVSFNYTLAFGIPCSAFV